MKLPAYPEYKYSGVPWLGQIPAHWEFKPLFSLAKHISIVNCINKPLLSVYLNKGVVKFVDVEEKRTNATSEDLSKYQLVEIGNLVLNNQQAWRGSVGVSAYSGIVSPAYIVLSLNSNLHSPWANYYFRDRAMICEYAISSRGVGSIQRNIYWDKLKRAYIAVPPNGEQKKISNFISWKTSQISKFIRNKRRLIALLKEQKQNIINKAVTRGINPDVRLKPSGVDWIGDIPEHWEVQPIKRAFLRMSYGTSTSSISEGRFLVLGMGNIKNGEIHYNNCGRLDDISPELILQPNDLLFNRTNSLDLVGKVGIFRGIEPQEVTFASYLVCMRVNSHNDAEYLNYLLNSSTMLSFVRLHAIPSLHQANLNPTRYGRLPIPLPPKEEQEIILQKIKVMTSRLDSAMISAERQIQLITEYRDRLIADVVTGKVDVRGIAVPEVSPEDLITENSDTDDFDEEMEDNTGESEE